LRKKTLKGINKLGGSSLSFATLKKQSRTMTSQDPSSSLSSTSEEKKLKDDDKLGGLLLSLATQEKPTSRFFSWVAEDDNELKGSSSSFGFFCFFLELQKTTMNGEARHCFLQCKEKKKTRTGHIRCCLLP
jgi:hypothetical protein